MKKAFEPTMNIKRNKHKIDISFTEKDEDSSNSYRNSKRKDTANHKNLQTIEISDNYKKYEKCSFLAALSSVYFGEC